MMTVRDIMTTEIITVNALATVAEAVALMKERSFQFLVVKHLNKSTTPCGIISETDVIYKVAAFGHDPKRLRVYEIMQQPCITVTPEMDVASIARLFAQTRVSGAPVIQQGKLIGVVSATDILHKGDLDEQPGVSFEAYLLEAAIEEAYAICADQGQTSSECAAAWEIVEDLRSRSAQKHMSDSQLSGDACREQRRIRFNSAAT